MENFFCFCKFSYNRGFELSSLGCAYPTDTRDICYGRCSHFEPQPRKLPYYSPLVRIRYIRFNPIYKQLNLFGND